MYFIFQEFYTHPLLSGDVDVTYTSNILLLVAASFIAWSTTLDLECVSIV